MLGFERARMFCFRAGFEQGRREAARHYGVFDNNVRLALQAAPVFWQLQGRCSFEPVRFEFDLDENTLYREVLLRGNAEVSVQRMASDNRDNAICWATAGYLSGHVSELVGRKVLTVETECAVRGDLHCRFISRLDSEWGNEVDWERRALEMESIEEELVRRDELVANAQGAARRAQRALVQMQRRIHTDLMLEGLIADSDAMAAVVRRAQHFRQTDAPVLLLGESGTGRETIARAIHSGSARSAEPFTAVDCVGLSGDALTRELFGYDKSAFPGATLDYRGAVERTRTGTLYLDEITHLSAEAQGMLCRALQDGAFAPLGSDRRAPFSVRLIAATQFDPEERREAGAFREDLYYALTVTPCEVPPLRERETDVLRLADLFLNDLRDRHNRPGLTMTEAFRKALLECSWPGNVRQLRHVLEHAVLLTNDGQLDVVHLPEEILTARWKGTPRDLTKEVIQAALRKTRGNRSRAAEMLQVGRTTLWRAMRRFDID